VIGAQRVDGDEEDAPERRGGLVPTAAEEQERRTGSDWGNPASEGGPRDEPHPHRSVAGHLHSST